MNYQGIAQLPEGAVVWCEAHGELEAGTQEICFYDIFPMLVTIRKNQKRLIWCDEESYRIMPVSEAMDFDQDNHYWNQRPEPEQIAQGLPYAEACRLVEELEQPAEIST